MKMGGPDRLMIQAAVKEPRTSQRSSTGVIRSAESDRVASPGLNRVKLQGLNALNDPMSGSISGGCGTIGIGWYQIYDNESNFAVSYHVYHYGYVNVI